MTPPPAVDIEAMPGVWALADALSFGQCSRDAETYRYEGPYTPPSVEGTFMWPGTAGANNWGGAAVDPRTGILYVNSSRVVQVLRVIPREGLRDRGARRTGGSLEGGNERGFHPQEGSPYGIELTEWRTGLGCPAGSRPSAPSRPTT
jgi:quinoprotein glucose dehydrogenase